MYNEFILIFLDSGPDGIALMCIFLINCGCMRFYFLLKAVDIIMIKEVGNIEGALITNAYTKIVLIRITAIDGIHAVWNKLFFTFNLALNV
jgi:hypothetical protein